MKERYNEMAKQTVSELRQELACNKVVEKERELSNELYAIKLVERIVFGLVGLILVGVVGAIIALVLK